MRFAKNMLVACAVLLWLPATSHPLLELVEFIHADHTHHESDATGDHHHDADNHEAADGACRFSSTHVEVPVAKILSSFLLPAWEAPASEDWQMRAPLALGPDPPGAAPPELSPSWQFSVRAALPARAPSLHS